MKRHPHAKCPQTPLQRVAYHFRCMWADKHFKWHLCGIAREWPWLR